MPKIPPKVLEPFWQTTDGSTVRLYQGHVIDVLKRLPERSVQMCVTSPPYWGLRDYGTGTWVGGDPKCDHVKNLSTARPDRNGQFLSGSGSPNACRSWTDRDATTLAKTVCKCGARRIDQQLGSEPSPDCGTQGQAQCSRCFVCQMVAVFREVRRVLRDTGCLFLNLGDSYLRNGNLAGVPWRVSLALQADGWILRSDIPWVKRSPMPESVKNRPAKALEYVFMFAKKMGYFYDNETVKRQSSGGWSTADFLPDSEKDRVERGKRIAATGASRSNRSTEKVGETTRNFWQADLWFESVDTPHGLTRLGDEVVGIDATARGYEGAHFAVYPAGLIEPFILAGTSEHGCCGQCGAPWKRVLEERKLTRDRPNDYVKRTGEDGTGNSCSNSVAGVETKTVGWEPTCTCNGTFEKKKKKKRLGYGDYNVGDDTRVTGQSTALSSTAGKQRPEREFEVTVEEYVSDLPLEEHPVVPCMVLDPFIGSGTSCCVAIDKGRNSIGIDLSSKYLQFNAIPRIEGELLQRPALARLVPRRPRK